MPTKSVETIAISEFKATCLVVLERVRRTGASIIITKRGEPLAERSCVRAAFQAHRQYAESDGDALPFNARGVCGRRAAARRPQRP